MQLFHTIDIDQSTAQLSEEESFHCIRVLRMKTGDKIFFVDGSGGFYTGILEDSNIKKCGIRIVDREKEHGKRDFYLHIAIAPTKNIDRFEWFLEKATEIGIDEITPLICRHSERKEVKTERMTKVLVSAMKQSLKAYLPQLNVALPFSEAISKFETEQKFICNMTSGKNMLLKDKYLKGNSITLIIGPEGDFSETEIELAGKHNFAAVSLGDSRLRTETAGVMATAIVNIINQQ